MSATADDVVEAMARGMAEAFGAVRWSNLSTAAQGHYLTRARAAIRALPAGWVVAKVPEGEPFNYAMGVYANERRVGHNAALAAVRASAVEVG
jgi:hypothetical protein